MPAVPVNDFPWEGAFPQTANWSENTLAIDTVAYQTSSYLSLMSPNDQYVGVYPSARGKTLVLSEQSVLLRLNGTTPGYGCYERTINGVIDAES